MGLDFKLMSVHIRPAQISDIAQVRHLMDSVFGYYAQLEEKLTKYITQDDYSVFVALIDKKIIGVTTWCLKTDNDYSKYECFGLAAMSFMKNKSSAQTVNLAIDREHRNKGVGKKLSLAQLDWLKKINCEIVIGSSWINGSDDNSQHLYLNAGFKTLGESKNFLRAQLQNESSCSVCKTSECSCNSILFGIEACKLLQAMKNFSHSVN